MLGSFVRVVDLFNLAYEYIWCVLLKGKMRGSSSTSEFEKGKGWKGVEVGCILPAFQRAKKGV